MVADSGEPPGRRAEEAYAEYLALRTAAEESGDAPPDFEVWARKHASIATALRQLESDWRGFDELLKGALGRQ